MQNDPAVFYKLDEMNNLIGVFGCHVDDFLHAGNSEFERTVMSKIKERFQAGKIETMEFKYVGFSVQQKDDSITVNHKEYLENIENVLVDPQRFTEKHKDLIDDEQTSFRQLIGRLNWAVQGSRPDLAFDLIDLSTKLSKAKVSDLIRATKCISRLKEGPFTVKYPSLGPVNRWQIVVFTDAALGNLENSGSVGSNICFLVGSNGNACPLTYACLLVR